MNNPFVGFVPWIIFWVVAGPSSWEWASLGALVAAVILAIPSAERGSPKLLDVVSIAFFVVMAVLGILLDRADLDWLEDYSQPISSGVLAVAVLSSLAYLPFTEQYARDDTPREVWGTPLFKRINRVLTATWGMVFAVAAILGVIAQQVDAGSTAAEWLNWIIPIAIIIGAFKFTAWYPDQAKGEVDREPRPT